MTRYTRKKTQNNVF